MLKAVRVLIADGSPDPIGVAARDLRRAGFVVSQCDRAATVAATLRRQPFDLVLLHHAHRDAAVILEQPSLHGARVVRLGGDAAADPRVDAYKPWPWRGAWAALVTELRAVCEGADVVLLHPEDPAKRASSARCTTTRASVSRRP